MRIGIFGGTFDPIHFGHLIKAHEAREALRLDQVWFIPAGDPWMKRNQKVALAKHRLAMVELAIGTEDHFKSSDVEVKRSGPTYTIETIKTIRHNQGSDVELFLLIGTDSLRYLGQWKNPEHLLELVTIATFERPGSVLDETESLEPHWLDRIKPGARIAVRKVPGTPIDIKGSDIRRRVAEGKSVRYRTKDAVIDYINEQDLYR